MVCGDLIHEINSSRVVSADILKIHYQIIGGERVDVEQLAKNINSFEASSKRLAYVLRATTSSPVIMSA
jgi:hypothetical protein